MMPGSGFDRVKSCGELNGHGCGVATRSLTVRLDQRTTQEGRWSRTVCQRGQFTPVYGCWKGLGSLPLFAIFSGRRRVVRAEHRVRNSNWRIWIGTELRVFGRPKSRMANATQICHSLSSWLFTMSSGCQFRRFRRASRTSWGGARQARRLHVAAQWDLRPPGSGMGAVVQVRLLQKRRSRESQSVTNEPNSAQVAGNA